MVVIPRNNAPFTVFGSDGSVSVFRSKSELVKALGWFTLKYNLAACRPDTVEQWRKEAAMVSVFAEANARLLVLDTFGELVTLVDFARFVPGFTGHRWFSGSRPRRSRCMRYPKTYGERRMNAVTFEDEGEVSARPARKGKGMANTGCDRKLVLQRSWKVFRRNQWRQTGH
jgi:hypothetical protein